MTGRMWRWSPTGLAVLLLVACYPVRGEWCGGQGKDGGPCRVDGPRSAADWPEWIAGLQRDREALGVSAELAADPALDWVHTAFVQPQVQYSSSARRRWLAIDSQLPGHDS